jgi:hypothetical protein
MRATHLSHIRALFLFQYFSLLKPIRAVGAFSLTGEKAVSKKTAAASA